MFLVQYYAEEIEREKTTELFVPGNNTTTGNPSY